MINENVLVRNNLTHTPDYESGTISLKSFPMVFIYEELQNRSSSGSDIKDSSTTTSERKESMYIELWEEFSRIRKEQEDQKIAQLVLGLKQQLFYALKRTSVESEGISLAEQLIIKIAQEHSFRILGEVAQGIYLQYNDRPDILIGLCEGLERFDGEEVTPWGQTMLMGLLGHKNEAVKEAAAVLVENWAAISLLPVLRNVEIHADWLKAYIESVIKCLEGREKDVLRKEAI